MGDTHNQRPPMIELSNDSLRLIIYPEYGARIDSVVDRSRGKEWAWHPASYAGPNYRNDGSFDEHFEGGWEEVFPSDADAVIDENTYRDHGELWRKSWKVEEQSATRLRMSCSCDGVPVDVTKTIALANEPDASSFTVHYSFSNRSDREVPFLFKLHPAIAIDEGDRITLQANSVEPVDLGFSTIAKEAGPTSYPFVRGEDRRLVRIDRMRRADETSREFVYLSQLEGGVVQISSESTGAMLSIGFNTDQIPFVWLLTSFGGWKSATGEPMYLALVEPATTKPWDLTTALANGTCAILQPREMRDYRFSFSFTDADATFAERSSTAIQTA